jgi:hypothetical protein
MANFCASACFRVLWRALACFGVLWRAFLYARACAGVRKRVQAGKGIFLLLDIILNISSFYHHTE